MMMQTQIEQKLADKIDLSHLEVVNESGNHNVPPGSESHFKVVAVSDDFSDKNLLARHRLINEILAEELQGQIHALALHVYTEEEWNRNHNNAPMSPPCLGGDK